MISAVDKNGIIIDFYHFFFFFFFAGSTQKGLIGRSFTGNASLGKFSSSSGQHILFESALTSILILLPANFYFRLVTSSSCISRSFSLLCLSSISENPSLLGVVWQILSGNCLSSVSFKLRSFPNLLFKDFNRSFLMLFSNALAFPIAGRAKSEDKSTEAL